MRIIHLFSSYSHRNIGDAKRHSEAKASWWRAYKHSPDVQWVNVSVTEGDLKRNAKTVLGDPKALPFIRDYVDDGLEQARAMPDDMFAVTNDDCALVETIAEDLIAASIGWGSRRDFMALPRRVTKETTAKGHDHPGCDLFFMPVAAWAAVRAEFPDMVHGREAWDLVMRAILRKRGGKEVFNCVAHSMHMAYWLSHSDDPSSRHNQALAEQYRIANDLPPKFGLL